MKNLTVKNIIAAVGGQYFGPCELLRNEVSFITTDSRKAGENCLFAAIKGENSDGNDYIGSSYEKGALCAIGQIQPQNPDRAFIKVRDTVSALGDLAAFYRSGFNLPIIGITGSVGKTTAKEMVSAVLSQRFNVHKTQKNLNNDLGVPLTLFGLDSRHQAAVVEMGISHFGEMARLAEIVRPTMALYTTIGCAHLEFLGDLDGVLKAKSEMLHYLPADGTVFVNGDDNKLKNISCKQKVVLYGVCDDCQVTAENIRILGTQGMELTIVSGGRHFEAKINSFGKHLVTAALGAAAVGMNMGLTDSEIAAGLAAFSPVGSRAGIINTDSLTIIDDCYNANPTSVSAAIESLSMLNQRRVAILGDMMELGENAAMHHSQIGSLAAESGIDIVLATGELSENTVTAANKSGCKAAIHFPTKEELINFLPSLLVSGDAILVKASHSKHFETITEALKQISK